LALGTLPPTRIFIGHTDKVTDVDWSYCDAPIFASASDDYRVCVWDMRSPSDHKVCFCWFILNIIIIIITLITLSVSHTHTRTHTTHKHTQPAQRVIAHSMEVNSISFNHLDGNLIAAGSAGHTHYTHHIAQYSLV